MPQLRPVIILSAVLALCTAAAFNRTTRAADDPAQPAKGVPNSTVAPNPTSGLTRPGDVAKPGSPAAAAKSPPPGAPQVPEESASVRDDPTIAPDAKQSADNNVSFPSDI